VKLADKGADVSSIKKAIGHVPVVRYKPSVVVRESAKSSLKDERAIKNAFTLLSERIKPVFPDCRAGQAINEKIVKMQGKIQAIFQEHEKILESYFYHRTIEACFDVLRLGSDEDRNDDLDEVTTFLCPPTTVNAILKGKAKPVTQRSRGVWDECIMTVVDELKKIDYSDKEAFVTTGKLLHLRYPEIYKDEDTDLVRQRYAYHTRKNGIRKKKTSTK
jgi:hypothetical protein